MQRVSGLQHATSWNVLPKCLTQRREWKGSDIPTVEQGVRILGTPLGHPDCVHTFLQNVLDEHAVLLSRIPLVEDVQSA